MLKLLKQHLFMKRYHILILFTETDGDSVHCGPQRICKGPQQQVKHLHLAGTQLCAAAAAEGPCHPAHLYAPRISATQPSMSVDLNVHHRITCQESELSAVAHFSWACTCDFS